MAVDEKVRARIAAMATGSFTVIILNVFGWVESIEKLGSDPSKALDYGQM
jgi:hypothetical protein